MGSKANNLREEWEELGGKNGRSLEERAAVCWRLAAACAVDRVQAAAWLQAQLNPIFRSKSKKRRNYKTG